MNLGITEASEIKDEEIKCLAPKSLLVNEKIRVQISRNNKTWEDKLLPLTYLTLYLGPIVTSISPSYGSANSLKKNNLTIHGKNFRCLSKSCTQLKCKFIFKIGNERNSLTRQAYLKSSSEVTCRIPFLNQPKTVFVEITINNRDYTNNDIPFIYFDPFIFKLEPKLLFSSGKN